MSGLIGRNALPLPLHISVGLLSYKSSSILLVSDSGSIIVGKFSVKALVKFKTVDYKALHMGALLWQIHDLDWKKETLLLMIADVERKSRGRKKGKPVLMIEERREIDLMTVLWTKEFL